MNSAAPDAPLGHPPENPENPENMAYNFAIVGTEGRHVHPRGDAQPAPPRLPAAGQGEHHFDDEAIDWTAVDRDRDYVAPRRAAIHRLVGDATPTYLYWPHALERMQAFDPAMPLIAVFRDPIERLFSHWVMLRSRNLAWPDWPDFLIEYPHTSLPDAVPTDVRTCAGGT